MTTTAVLAIETNAYRNDFDYRPHTLRVDAAHPSLDLTDLLDRQLDHDLLYAGDLDESLVCIVQIWNQLEIPGHAVAAMAGVLTGFIAAARKAGRTAWADIDEDLIERFVLAKKTSPAVRRLRKTVGHGAYLALIDARVTTFSAAEGINPCPAEVRTDGRGKHRDNPMENKTRRSYDARVHVRSATSDEVLLTRLATRLARTNRTLHLCAAAVAACTSSATTSEAPQVVWGDLADTTLTLPGRIHPGEIAECNIAPRTVALDPWAAEALRAWHAEKSAVRAVDPRASILYSGNQATTSNSAQAGIDQQVRKALTIADLDRIPGFTAGSLRLWAACHTVTDYPSLQAAAAKAGVQPLTLHRQVAHLGERGL